MPLTLLRCPPLLPAPMNVHTSNCEHVHLSFSISQLKTSMISQMSSGLSRRSFLTRSALGGATLALAGVLRPAGAMAAPVVGSGPYGPVGNADALGLRLPAGFSARVVATHEQPVGDTDYRWHVFPDGGATFATDDGGWIYVSNSEVPAAGGVSAIRFAADGTIVDAYSILSGTTLNCAGGLTPWGTWLSCEEFNLYGQDPGLAVLAGAVAGRVWECDPFSPGQGVAREAMGLFHHEAAAVDPVGKRVYMTEDRGNGLFYRFTPTAYPDLSAGVLEAALIDGDRLVWATVPDPSAPTAPINDQFGPDEVTTFRGGEGLWYHQGIIYFTTKGDNRVHALECETNAYEVIYDAADFSPNPPLRGVDNLVVDEVSGDIFVAEDGGDMRLVLLSAEGEITTFAQIVGQDQSEVTGPAFSPDGTRLYFSSQRGPGFGRGVTYEVTGPFRGARPVSVQPAVPTTVAPAAAATELVIPQFTGGRSHVPGDVATAFRSIDATNDRGTAALAMGVASVAAVGAAAVLALRNRAHNTPAGVPVTNDEPADGPSGNKT